MAFLRFSRDKRGYEQFSLVEATTNRRGKSRARLLYWYRTPPNVRVGREPFDDAVRRALEAQNPGVQFDWRKIVETPIPSAETERWRERRRAEKAEKAARRAGSPAAAGGQHEEEETDDTLTAAPDVEAEEQAALETETAAPPDAIEDDSTEPIADAGGESERAAQTVIASAAPGRRRRRRRGRRGRPGPPSPAAPSSADSPALDTAPSHIEAGTPASEPEGN
jgi:hypothetical protein